MKLGYTHYAYQARETSLCCFALRHDLRLRARHVEAVAVVDEATAGHQQPSPDADLPFLAR